MYWNLWTLFRKEITGFFSGLTGYLVILVFLLLNSLFMWILPGQMNVMENGYATLDTLFSLAPWLFLFLVPAITMRMFSEEKRGGTLDLLLTRPVSTAEIVLAKLFSAWALVFLSLIPTLVCFWSVARLGNPVGNIDAGGAWGSYAGLLFLGGIYASVGIFTSSLTGNQIVAFITAVLGSFLMYQGFDLVSGLAGSGKVSFLISRLGIGSHYNSISRGVVDSRDLLYFLGVMAVFTAATLIGLRKTFSLWPFLITLCAVILLNLASGIRFMRLDLTAGKRYTLSGASREIMKGLDEPVFIRIYLDGELPPGFVHLRKSIHELMIDFRAYAGENLQFEFVNIYEEPDEALRNKVIADLYDKGLRVTSIQLRGKDGSMSTQTVFPGAMIGYKGYEIPVNLLKNNPSLSPETNLNNSIQTLEYEFIRAIYSLTEKDVPRIALIEGHGELDSLQTYSLMDELKNFFQVDRGYISGNVDALMNYKAIIIARPVRPFSDADKYAIDQYIMKGGKALFFLDPVEPFADSLTSGTTVALSRPVGLEDMLFRYGFRINYNLVADLQCNLVPVNTAPAGEQARFTMMPWVYDPLLAGPPGHPITRGLNYVLSQFASSMDTVGAGNDLHRTILLGTSPASRSRDVPLYLDMEEVTRAPDPKLYGMSNLPVCVLAEGTFSSFFGNYPVPEGVSPASWREVNESAPTSVFVATDGDLIANEVRFEQGAFRAQPLGYDRYSRQTFGNLEFVMNVINYMTDDTGIMELRSREFRLRLLSREKLATSALRIKWKLLNTLVPLLLVAMAGFVVQWNRKRRYR